MLKGCKRNQENEKINFQFCFSYMIGRSKPKLIIKKKKEKKNKLSGQDRRPTQLIHIR